MGSFATSVVFSKVSRLRKAVAENPTRGRTVRIGALLLLGVPLAAALNGAWGYAVVGFVVAVTLAWIGGVWVMPWGVDAYMRRLARLSSAWKAETVVARGRTVRRRVDRRKRLSERIPPPQWAFEHAQLLELVEREDSMRQGEITPITRVEIICCQLAADELLKGLDTAAFDESQRTYVLELKALHEEARHDSDEISRSWRVAAQETAEKMSRIKPPAAAAADNELLIAAMYQLIETEKQLQTATLSRNLEAVKEAAARIAQADAEIRSINERLQSKLA